MDMSRYFAQRAREPMSSYTHFWGAVASVAATVLMVLRGIFSGASWLLVLGAGLFGLSLIALYTASSVYHFVVAGPRRLLRLRKLDHGLAFVAGMWGMALAGILIKLLWLDAPRALYTGLYLAMGWAIVLDIPALAAMPAGCFWMILAGGLLYSIGAVLYIIKKPNLSPTFGFHELFHLFILAGSACHILAVLVYVL